MQGLLLRKKNYSATVKKGVNLSVIFGFITLIGVMLGAVFAHSQAQNQQNYISVLLQTFIVNHKKGNFFEIMSLSFLSGFILNVFVLFCSFCCVGFALIPLAALLKGAFCGCLTAYLYLNYGAKGAFLNVLLFWLPQVVQAVMLVALCTVAFNASVALFYNTFLGQKQGISAKYNRCWRSFVFTGLGLVFTALIESCSAYIFAPILL